MKKERHKTILLVDNNEDASLNCKNDLELFGYKVIPAYSGEQALEAVDKKSGIDLVLMDIYPGTGMDGAQVAELILKNHDLPIVFILTCHDPETVKKIENTTSYGFVERNSGSAIWNMSIKMALRLFEEEKTKEKELAERKQAEEALHKSEERHRHFFETMSPGVIYQDADGTISYANPASEKILGLTFDQMRGKTSMDPRWKMITENGRKVSGANHPAMTALRTGKKVGPVTRGVFIPEKNRYIWLSITAVPLYHPDGEKPFQVYATFEDISRRKQAEQQLRERNKELYAFYILSGIIERKNITLDEIYQEITEILPKSYQYPEITCARIVIDNREFRTPNFTETRWMQSTPVYVNRVEAGKIEVGYTEKIPDKRRHSFLPEEQWLIDAFAERVGYITGRMRTEQALREQEELNKTIMDHLPLGIAVNSANSPVEFRYMNDKFPEIYRTTRQALSKPDAFWKVVYEDPEFRQKIRKRVLEDCESGDPDRMYWEDIPFTRGEKGPFYICASNIPLPESQLMVSTVWDVTARKQAEKKLNQERLLLRTIIDSIPDSIYAKDMETRKFIANKTNYHNMGFEREEDVIGKTDFDIYPPEIAKTLFEDDQQVLKHGESVVNREEKIVRPNGEVKWNLTTKVPLHDQNGVIMGMVGIGRDITERKLAEIQIHRNLEEKNVLLVEIHHRVKNNMAVISSLLELQTEFFDPRKDTKNLLLDTKNRIQSMAMVHELVYESSNFAEISADKLLQRLAGHLGEIYRAQDKNISIQVHSDPIMLDVNKSVPFTLLANEVISNAFKHAFTDRQSCNIDVLFEVKENGYRFVVADNGKGVPDHGQLNNPKSLGLTIIQGLTHQLKGKIEYSSPPEGGFKVTLWIPGMTEQHDGSKS